MHTSKQIYDQLAMHVAHGWDEAQQHWKYTTVSRGLLPAPCKRAILENSVSAGRSRRPQT